MLPKRNAGDLMLLTDVRDAVAAGDFHVYAVSSVEDGIEILTGVPAGERGEDGEFPEGTVFRAVEEKLTEYLDALSGGDREDWQPIRPVPGSETPAPPEPTLPGGEPPDTGTEDPAT
jgi:hypothetical protein